MKVNNVTILCRCQTGPGEGPNFNQIREAIDLLFQKISYQLGKLIGVGAQAHVYKLEGPISPTVIKIYHNVVVYDHEKGYRGDASVLKLEPHRNLCLPSHLLVFTPGSDHNLRITDETPQPGEKVIASIYDKLPKSISLLELISWSNGIDVERLRYLGRQVLEGLLHLHQHGFLHRDLKPDNIYISENYEVKVIDFGMSRNLREERSMTFSGTPEFLAPEILLESQAGYDFRAEVWTFGAILYNMASGQFAFKCDSPMDLLMDHTLFLDSNEPFSIWKGEEDMDPMLREVIDRCLLYHADDRLTLAQLAMHPFFQKSEEAQEHLDIKKIKEAFKKRASEIPFDF